MPDASANKSLIVTDFSQGWVLKRGTHSTPTGLLELDNAWVEPDGSIISRPGVARINQQPLTDGTTNINSKIVHSHILSGGLRYVGVGSVIKRGIDPGENIVTGLSGGRVSFAQMSPSFATTEQWTYFANGDGAGHGAANGDCRKKDNGEVTRNWGIDGPNSAPTIALFADLPTWIAIDSFDTAYTVIDTGSEAAAVEPYFGGARTFGVTSENTCRFRRTISSIDLSPFGDFGFIRMMVRLSRIPDMRLLSLAFDVSDGTFTKDFYEVSTHEVGFGTDNSWAELRIRKSNFVRTKSTAGSILTWSTVVAIQFTVAGAGNNPNPFEFSVDDMRLEDDTHPQGIMDYRMTWWSEDLKIRSNSRSLADVYAFTDRTSETLNVPCQAIRITKTATTTDPQVTHWELWRRNHNVAGIFQFVARIPIDMSTYQDEFTDEQLGEQLFDDNHIPPPARFVLEFDDSLFLFGMTANDTLGTGEEQGPYSVRYSPRYRAESFPLTHYFLAGDPVDTITGGCVWQNQLWIFTKKHIFRVEKTANGYVAQLTEAPVGTECPYSISPSPYGIFYNVPFHGPHVFNGSTAISISAKSIQPFFDGEIISTDGINIPVATPSSVTEYTNIVGQYHNGTYTMVIDDSVANCRTLVYNVEFQRWHRISGKDFIIQRLSSERAGDATSTAKNLEAGNANGWLLLLTPVLGRYVDPDNEPITVTMQLTFDALLKTQDSEIDLKDIVIDTDTAGQSLLVEASFDDNPLEALDVQNAVERSKLFFPVPGAFGEPAEGRICYKASVRVTINQTTRRASVYGIGVNYWLEPRRSTSYSGLWHAPREKGWARRGRFVMRTYAPVNMHLVFDDNKVYDAILPTTQGRRLGLHPTVVTGMEGKVAYILLTSTEPFVIYETSYMECGVFGAPAQMVPWYFARWESRA